MRRPAVTGCRQQGISLVSLMVGTTISLLVMAGLMQVFKNVVTTTQSAQQDATADGDVATALLTAGWAVQSAGFGIVNPKETTDLLLLRDASLSAGKLTGVPVIVGGIFTATAGKGTAWIWRNKARASDTVTQCQALWAPIPSADPNATAAQRQAGLQLLGPVTPCPSDMLTATWGAVQVLATTGTFALSTQWEACHPMGHAWNASTPQMHIGVQISTANRAGIALREYWCLRNFTPPV